MNDLKLAFRQLLKNPGFTAVVVLTLALGIGANTAIFSFIQAIVLRPLPYADPGRLVQLWSRESISDRSGYSISLPNFMDLKRQSESFAMLAYYRPWTSVLTGSDSPEEVASARVSAGFFELLGVSPLLGRTFVAEEDAPEQNRQVILSNALWQRQFGGDPRVVGRKVALEGVGHVVVGVMPPEFDFPKHNDLWIPYGATHKELTLDRHNHLDQAIGRLKKGVSQPALAAELTAISSRLEAQFPEANTHRSLYAASLLEGLIGPFKPALTLLFVAVGGVLLIACGNVAHLQLVRGIAGQREITVRMALGATRARIVRQLVAESLLLSGVGALLGLAIAQGLIPWLSHLAPANVPRIGETRLDLVVLAYAVIISMLTGLAFGVLPAFRVSNPRLVDGLKAQGRSTTSDPRHRRTLQWLMVAELTTAVVLLAGAGLFLQSFYRLEKVELGFNPDNAASVKVRLPWNEYHPQGRDVVFFRQLRERLSARQGIEKVGMVCGLPTTERGTYVWVREPGTDPKPGEEWRAQWNYASPSYFEAMGIPLIAGRALDEHDTPESRRVILVSESLAERYFPGQDPIGKQLLVEGQDDQRFSIVGVVGSVLGMDRTRPLRDEIYFSDQQVNVASAWLVVRHTLEITPLDEMIRAEVHAMDLNLPLRTVQPVEEQLYLATKLSRFRTFLLTALAGVAAFLTAVGIYSLINYHAILRRREFGVRMALGACSADILRHVLAQSGRLALVGVVLGVAASLGLARFIDSMLFGIDPFDTITFGLVPVAAMLLVLLASWLPARRAAKVDAMEVLRSE